MELDKDELERYDRQILIPNFGREAQEKLKSSSVAVVGLGGLGSISSLYLVAAGVGKLVLIDRDRYQLSDLNRQILCSEKDLGRRKVEVAKEKLTSLNSKVEVECLDIEVTKENLEKIGKVDVIVDGTDNWETRFLLNEYCVANEIPFIHAGVSEFHGHLVTVMPRVGPCLKCIFPRSVETPEKIAVIGATPCLFASLQVMEAIKLLTGIGKPLSDKMLFLDGKDMEIELIRIRRNPKCEVCGRYPPKSA